MKKNLGLLISTVLCFLVAATLVQNFQAQHASQQKITELERKLDGQNAKVERPQANDSTAHPSMAEAPAKISGAGSESSSPLILSRNELPSDYAERQRRIVDVMTEGWKLINQRKAEPAVHAAELFQAALDKIDDKSPDLYNGLGRALLIAGKPKEAIGAWRKGLAIQPQMAEMQSGIGWAYWHLQDPYHAKAAWDAALVVDPKCADAWSAVAWVDLALGQKDVAKRGFQALYEHDQKNNQWIMGLAMAQAGNSDLAQIRQFFPVPDVAAFTKAPATDPAGDVAVNMAEGIAASPQL